MAFENRELHKKAVEILDWKSDPQQAMESLSMKEHYAAQCPETWQRLEAHRDRVVEE